MDKVCGKKKRYKDDGELTFVDQVFSWCVKDILDEILSMKKDPTNSMCRSPEWSHSLGKLFGPFCFINIQDTREEVDDDGFGRRNLVEVALVMKIVQRLYKEWQCSKDRLRVRVISPYAAQVIEINRRLGKVYENLRNFELKAETLEEFQDGESDVIIVSTVRSNCNQSQELISDCQRTDVALTRARHCLWLLGSEVALAKESHIWEAVISGAKEHNCYLNANEDRELAQLITTVKSQLNELEDLLHKGSSIFEGARWKVVFSEVFVKSFSKLPSTFSKKVVLSFLLKLANGWRPKKYKAEGVYKNFMEIAKAYKVEGRYIVCTNDIFKNSGYAIQVLKVWDILHLVDVPALVNNLDRVHEAFTDEFLKCCKEKCLEGELEVPRRYSSFYVDRYKSVDSAESIGVNDASFSLTRYIEDCKVNESLLLMKFYSFSADLVSHLLSAADGTEIVMPFEVTDEEQEVILHRQTSFVLGRSGTGKTTVLVMKLMQKEQLHLLSSKGLCMTGIDASVSSVSFNQAGTKRIGTSLRQLYVTVNPRLCIAVKQQISNIQRFVSGESISGNRTSVDFIDMDECEFFKDVPSTLVETPSNVFPLVITFNMLLLMLDGTLGTSYFSRFPDIRKIYSLETANSRMIVQKLVRRREVTFEKFRNSYWPHFNSKLTKKLDPSRVFTEISSHIKGGLHFGQVNLSLESYLQLSGSRGSTFSEYERKEIYKIFQDYEKLKMTRGEFDLADLVNDLHHRLNSDKYEDDCMDFIYIDEVQDLTMKQLALLKYICKNVEEGFVFAGDTAQTIAKGVHFRFEDIRSLFYKDFLCHNKHVRDFRKEHELKFFHLRQNFRTHSGILNLAQSITELIYHFFPHSIDKLKPEKSFLCGEAPILLDCGCLRDAMSMIFQIKGNEGENVTCFGSDQVILVRDDCVRDEVVKCIGRRAMVLTIFECKGLEFQDVLLYNFFGTSPLEEQWRVIYKYFDETTNSTSESFPSFSHSRHNILCYELKQLYVAITRTIQRLWICEDTNAFLSPMVRYWKKLKVVEVKDFDVSFAQQMPVISSPEEWKLQGLKMLEVRNFKIAAQCFNRAGECILEMFSTASDLKEAAQNSRGVQHEFCLKMLREAADLFKKIGNAKKAAECYFDAEDYERAGQIYFAESDIQRAGHCYTLGGCFEIAAKIYAEASFFSDCLNACSKGKLFELGLHYTRSWKLENLSHLVSEAGMDLNAKEQEFLEKCAHASYKQQDKEAMMKYVRDFNSMKVMRTFLKKLDCLGDLLELEVDLGNYGDAAKVARRLGYTLREADLLEKAHHYHGASKLYFAFVLASSLWANGSKGWPLKEFQSKEELSSKAKTSANKYSPYFYKTVCTNLQLLSSEKYGLHELEKKLELSQKDHNLKGEILAARKILDLLLHYDVSMFGWDTYQKIPDTRVPITRFCRHWNFWKEKIINCLFSLKAKKTSKYSDYGEFCLEYLGVRKRSSDRDAGYCVFYPDAEWIKSVLRRSDKLDSLNQWQLTSAAERYWSTELLSVGMKVLETFESVLKLGVRNSMPAHCLREIQFHIFEAAATLLTWCKYIKQTSPVWHSLIDYFARASSLSQSKLLTLDELTEIEAHRNLLREAIFRRFKSLVASLQKKSLVADGEVAIREPGLAQVIQVAVILLGSSYEIKEPHKEIISKFKIGSPWKSLLNSLVGTSTQPNVLVVVCHLRDYLSDIYKSRPKWKEGSYPISPSCFVYLLDRLLLMVSCFTGCLFATRSSVIEWLVHLHWQVSSNSFAVGDDEFLSTVSPTYDFLADTVHDFLLNLQLLKEWILKTAAFDSVTGFPLLIKRLVVLMCLICLNTGKYLELLDEALCRSDIIVLLPTAFKEVLFKRSGSSFSHVVAEALQKLEDPLVVIKHPKVVPRLYIRHAVFLNVFNREKEQILEALLAR